MSAVKWFALSTLILVSSAYGLFQVSKSRTFQFFGGLTSRVETEYPAVALTFDDAPTEYTRVVLDQLGEKDVLATFYMIGQAMEEHPETAREIAAAGHEMGNHSYSHQRMVLKSRKFIESEIQKTNALIRSTGYGGPITFRPPYGKKLWALPQYLAGHDIRSVMCDVEPDTYLPKNGSDGEKADFLTTYTLEHVQPGSIILLHPFCGGACEPARMALPRIIDGLRNRGYQLVTVSDLLDTEHLGQVTDRQPECPPPPPEYLMRSSCPYTSAKIDGVCRVVCPISRSTAMNQTCDTDADCDCAGYSGQSEKTECRCVNNACLVAVDEIDISDWPHK